MRFRGRPEEVERGYWRRRRRTGAGRSLGCRRIPGRPVNRRWLISCRNWRGFSGGLDREWVEGDAGDAVGVAVQRRRFVDGDGGMEQRLIDEYRNFPAGRNDDQVDAGSRAFAMLVVASGRRGACRSGSWRGDGWMTIIAIKNGVMVADSFVNVIGRMYSGAEPKIKRGPGGLIGIAGSVVDLHLVGEWFARGEVATARPDDLKSDDDAIEALILRPDGSVLWMDQRLLPVPTTQTTVGYKVACDFCEGAMAAGLSAEDAVALTIRHCAYVGGPLQVEPLSVEPAAEPAFSPDQESRSVREALSVARRLPLDRVLVIGEAVDGVRVILG